MIHFFGNQSSTVFAVQTTGQIVPEDINKLNWLFGGTEKLAQTTLEASFVGPRAAMVTPWSTNAVEITQNMGIEGITRIEEFKKVTSIIFKKQQFIDIFSTYMLKFCANILNQ